MGIPEFEAKQYEDKIKSDNVLISVHTEDGKDVDRAKDLFKRLGVSDVSSTAETPRAREVSLAGPPSLPNFRGTYSSTYFAKRVVASGAERLAMFATRMPESLMA